eukprot:784166-Amorphochlora_amoeboformis.AAC.1
MGWMTAGMIDPTALHSMINPTALHCSLPIQTTVSSLVGIPGIPGGTPGYRDPQPNSQEIKSRTVPAFPPWVPCPRGVGAWIPRPIWAPSGSHL